MKRYTHMAAITYKNHVETTCSMPIGCLRELHANNDLKVTYSA